VIERHRWRTGYFRFGIPQIKPIFHVFDVVAKRLEFLDGEHNELGLPVLFDVL